MAATGFMIASAGIILALGVAHLVFTFFSNKLEPRDSSLRTAMDNGRIRITSESKLWKAWIGFNASHSVGILFFGFIYGYLAVAHPELLFSSLPLQAAGFVVLLTYVILAKAYWFKSPLYGASAALLCYCVSIGIS